MQHTIRLILIISFKANVNQTNVENTVPASRVRDLSNQFDTEVNSST